MMHQMTGGPYGPTRRSDNGMHQVLAGAAAIPLGTVVVPDYTNVSGLVSVTASPGAANHPESVWIAFTATTAGVRTSTSTPFGVVTETQATKGGRMSICLQGYCEALTTAAGTTAFGDMGINLTTSTNFGPAATGSLVLGQAQAAGGSGALIPVYWTGAMARAK